MSKAGRSKEQDEQYEERPVGSAVLTPTKINNDESRRDDEQGCGNDRVGGSMNQIEPRTQHLGVRRGVLRAREDSEPRRHFCSLSQKPVTSGGAIVEASSCCRPLNDRYNTARPLWFSI